MVILVIKIIVGAIIGFFSGQGAIYAFNHIPAKWLCDYGEDPYYVDHPKMCPKNDSKCDEKSAGRLEYCEGKGEKYHNQRICSYPWKYVASIVLIIADILLLTRHDISFAIPACIVMFFLFLTGVSDHKYMIIPDQFALTLAICTLGFVPYHMESKEVYAFLLNFGIEKQPPLAGVDYLSLLSPIAGSIFAGGLFLGLAIIGKLLFKKDALGMGDVKLFFSLGLLLGFKGSVYLLVLTSFTSAVVFSKLLLKKKIKMDSEQPLGDIACIVTAFYLIFLA